MLHQPTLLFLVLAMTMALFVWGRWRYDIVALFSLVVCLLLGLVPYSRAFSGLGNPAVITVACVMIFSAAISQSGLIDYAVKKLAPVSDTNILYISTLCIITAVLSAFMNNIGALSLMMPIGIQSAINSKRSPSMILMPMAFASALGGLTTLIGTPPNLLIASYRQEAMGQSFSMFSFAPVGFTIAIVGVIFISIIGWKLLPKERKGQTQEEDMFKIQDYITEIKISPESTVIDITVSEFENFVEGDFTVVGIIRRRQKKLVIPPSECIQENDVVILKSSHDDLKKLLRATKLEILGEENITFDILRSDDTKLIEAVVPQGSRLEGRSSRSIRLRSRYRMNLLAISRAGTRLSQRLNQVRLRPGDVVMLQGEAETLQESAVSLGFLPLVERGIETVLNRSAFLPLGIFLISIIIAALQLIPVQIAFMGGVLALVLFNGIPARKLYDSIDWPIVVLLAAMIPIGIALETTGATTLITQATLKIAGQHSPYLLLGILLIITMTLSDLMNNAATTVVMAPIALSIAQALHLSVDPFLMTVAVGASCSFLTPIGHQNNTIVMGPGGYKFHDYIRLGLPIELLVLVVGLPMIIWIWPL